MGGGAETRRRPRWRPWLAVIVAPLGALPSALLFAWNNAEEFGGLAYALANIWLLPAFAAVTCGLAGLIVWGLMACLKASVRAWVVIPAFLGVYALLLWALSGPGAAVFHTVVVGLPVSLTYCLVAGVPLRSRRPASA